MKATIIFRIVVFCQFFTYMLFGMNIQFLFDDKESAYLFFVIPLFFTYIFDNTYTVFIDLCKPTEILKEVENKSVKFINIFMLVGLIIYGLIYKHMDLKWLKSIILSANKNMYTALILIILISFGISFIWSKYWVKSDYIEKLKEEDFDILGIEKVINWLAKSNVKSKDIAKETSVSSEKIELLLKDGKNIDDFSYREVKSILAYAKYVRDSK